jgi:hypothetical protein
MQYLQPLLDTDTKTLLNQQGSSRQSTDLVQFLCSEKVDDNDDAHLLSALTSSSDDSVLAVHSRDESDDPLQQCKLFLVVALGGMLMLEGADLLDGANATTHLRAGNIHRDRGQILLWADNLDDTMFERQFRLCREDFATAVELISGEIEPNYDMARRSSGSPISTRLALMITLRILAGASYLDMIHYHVHVDSVHKLVWRVVHALHQHLDNINLPQNETEMQILAARWDQLQMARWGSVLTPGTILAGDGLAVAIEQPTATELHGRRLDAFHNRKGFWAVLCLAFCNADCRFAVFDVRWPGGVNDIIAYPTTDIFHKTQTGYFPDWCSLVLDQAFSSCGGIHMTPHTVHQLRRAKEQLGLQYMLRLCAYDYVQSSQRISIERSFGMLVRRFGILWRPMACSLRRIPTIVRTCAMLHNMAVDRWIRKGRPTASLHPPAHIGLPAPADPSNQMVQDTLGTATLHPQMDHVAPAVPSNKRAAFAQRICDAGLRMSKEYNFGKELFAEIV